MFNISYGASSGPYAKKYFRIGDLGDVNDGWTMGASAMTEMALRPPHSAKKAAWRRDDYIVSAHSGGARAAAGVNYKIGRTGK